MAEEKTFWVQRRMAGTATIYVTAADEEEAARKIAEGDWDETEIESWELLPEGGCRGNVCGASNFPESDIEEG